jgi:hypothetical protein
VDCYVVREWYLALQSTGILPYSNVARAAVDGVAPLSSWVAPLPPDATERSWILYALSRIDDLLLLPPIAPDRRDGFWSELGLTRIAPRGFHPFFHEIVEVVTADHPDEPPSILGERWSGWMLHDLMFSRAGVVVRAGSDHIVKAIAERSALYWTFRRHDRRCHDLSHGWGSNSQWRTSFRRDLIGGGAYHYNVDGRPQTPSMVAELTPAQRRELLVHRCFVRSDVADDDLFPFDETETEPIG